FPHMLAEQAVHVAYIIRQAMDKQVRVLETTAAAEQNWVDEIKKLALMRRAYLEACTPGYYNNEGKPADRSEQDGWYGAGPIAFVKFLEDWREQGSPKGLAQT